MMSVGFAWYWPMIRPGCFFAAAATSSLSPAISAISTPALSIAATILSASVPL